MDKETIKSFILWLESASEKELDDKRQEIRETYPRVSSKEGRADINLALRLLDEEILARLSLKKLG
jgi:hypothetical protein